MTRKKLGHRRLYQRSIGLKAWWALLRAEHGLIAFFGVVIGELLVTRQPYWGLLFPAVGPALIVWGAFALNDYWGYKSDMFLRRIDRPIVAGMIGRTEALVAGLLLMAAGAALTWPVNATAFGIALAYVAGALVYDPVLKKVPVAGNAFIASTMTVPFLYGSAAVTNSLEFQELVLILSGVAFLTGLGREMLKTTADVKGDRKLGAFTLPMLVGSKPTIYFSALLMLAGALLSLAPLAIRFSPTYALLISISNIAMFACVEQSLGSQKEGVLRRCRDYSLVGMMLGILAFLGLAMGL